jgi:hypothetical protein
MARPLLVIALVLLVAVPKGAAGRPWNVTFGGCVFTGDTDGSPLVRQGSCPDQAGLLDLSHKNITVVPGTAFRCMTQLGSLDLSYNKITELPGDIFAGLTSLVGLSISNNNRYFRDGSQPPPSAITDQEAQCYWDRYPDVRNVLKKESAAVLIADSGKKVESKVADLVVAHTNEKDPDARARNIDAAKTHWIQIGKNEKRDWSCPASYPMLPETIFANLFSLKYIDMSNNSYSDCGRTQSFVESIWNPSGTVLPGGIFAGLNLSALDVSCSSQYCCNSLFGMGLKCVPLTNDQKGALIVYDGPERTCEPLEDLANCRNTIALIWGSTTAAYFMMIFLTMYILRWAYGGGLARFREGINISERRSKYNRRFESLDTNGDGYISEEEFKRGWSIYSTTSFPQEDSTATQGVMHLQWEHVGSEKPSTGTEIMNELLAAALQDKVQFKKEEWEKFHLTNLSSDSYIKAGDRYFKPAENIVWKDEKWVYEQTGNPSDKKGKSPKDSKKSFWDKNSKNVYSNESPYPLKNFPFKWLVKDNKGKISKNEYKEGFELVEAFLQFEAGICLPLCRLLRAKYLDEKERQKKNTNIVGDVTGELGVSHPSPLPGTPSPAEIPVEMSQPPANPKCDIETLKMGCSAVAAQGLRSAVGLDDDEVFANMMQDPEIAIECEILVAGLGGHVNGCIDDIDNYYSIKFGKSWREEEEWKDEENEIDIADENGKAPIPQHVKNSARTKKYHGGDFKKEDYDTGNKGKQLKDFHNDPASVLAGLLIWEVLIIRLYTSTTYRLFNGPMRSLLTKDGQKSQHPLRFTIYALTEGIKKLRAVEARSDEKGFNTTKVLWRGMANKELGETFESVGGTEMAVMSTTSDKEVALSYAQSKFPLVFKYNTVGLTRGVKIQFLSLYPKEVEFVYPPLTFLSVVSKPYVEGNVRIVEVMPQMS